MVIFLMLPLSYEDLAGMKGLISMHYIRLDIYTLAFKPLKYVNTLWLGVYIAMVRYIS